MNDMLSVIIPARNEIYLQKTIESILFAAEGEIEVIAILDGYWPEPVIRDDSRVTLIHHTNPIGQRAAINEGVRVAKGKYILKTDGHSLFDQGFDTKLKADCEYDWTVVPRMYNLDAENWKRKEKYVTDYMYIRSPHIKDRPLRAFYLNDGETKREYREEYKAYKNASWRKGEICDVMTGQGACWFMHKDRFWELGGMDEAHGSWGQVGVEVALKAWLSGGSLKVNKKTWFAHMFRTTAKQIPYKMSGKDQQIARNYSLDFWMGEKWDKQIRPLSWLVKKFSPVPTWNDSEIEVSVIIPARNEKYLQATIFDIFRNFQTSIEVIVGLDDCDCDLKGDERLNIYRSPERIGMRPMINKLASMAKGKYLLKTDAHCSFDEGYDKKLIKTLEKGGTVLGIRYELDVEKWERKERTNCDFRYLSNPDVDPKGGLRGLPWHEYKKKTKSQKVAESMSLSGSGWLMEREQFNKWGGLDENHGTFGQEGCEIACKTWLSGGRLLINRDTWYAHWNRGKAPYALSTKQRDKSVAYSIDYWMNNKWPLQKHKFQWLLDKFQPPGWPSKKIPHLKGVYGYRVKHFKVDDLFDNFLKYANPLKNEPSNPRGTHEFLRTFVPFIDEVVEGTITHSSNSLYFGYLAKHLHPDTRGTQKGEDYVVKKMVDAANLYFNIKDDGLNTPLDMFKHEGGLTLIRGSRRVIILKKLGIERVPVRVFESEELYKKNKRRVDIRHGGVVEQVAIKQFSKMGLNGTDKYWHHNYPYLFDRHLKGLPKKPKILEIGVKQGASLLMWKKAYPHAQVSGIDIKDVSDAKILQKNPDLKLYVGKQGDIKFLNSISNNGSFKHYDLIVDDGSHLPKDQLASFNALWPHVAKGGVYVIEDIFSGKGREDRYLIMDRLKSLSIFPYGDTASISYYPNICFIEKV